MNNKLTNKYSSSCQPTFHQNYQVDKGGHIRCTSAQAPACRRGRALKSEIPKHDVLMTGAPTLSDIKSCKNSIVTKVL